MSVPRRRQRVQLAVFYPVTRLRVSNIRVVFVVRSRWFRTTRSLATIWHDEGDLIDARRRGMGRTSSSNVVKRLLCDYIVW